MNDDYIGLIKGQDYKSKKRQAIKFNTKNKYAKLKKKPSIKFYIINTILIILIITAIITIILWIKYKLNDSDEKFEAINLDDKTIFQEEEFDSYQVAFNKAKYFLSNSKKGILINTKKIKLSKNPKISVVIPCFNCEEYVLTAVRSIQNQNFSDFEIVITDDFSNSSTSLYLEELKKEDDRIKIVRNNKNMGTLYSRSIGCLSSTGKYLFPIDSDDMLLDKDVFSSVINVAEKGNFDIIVFNSLISSLKPTVESARIFIHTYHKPNLVLFQPYLGYFPIYPSHKIDAVNYNEVYIHGKCVKTKIYQEALNKLGIERYSRYMLLVEDIIANYIIFNTAKVAKYISKFGYLYYRRKGSVTKKRWSRVKLALYDIYFLDVLIDFSKDLTRNKKVLVNFVNIILGYPHLKNALNTSEYNNKVFISCLERILNCSHIADEYKNEIKDKVKSLDFIKYNF